MDRDFEAMECLREGLAILPDATCFVRLAHLEQSLGDPAHALEAAVNGLQLDPKDTMGHIVAAKSLIELSKESEADKHWQSAARLVAPNGHLVDLERARFLRENGQFDRARAEAEAIIGRRPDCAGALCLLAESSRATDRSLADAMERLALRAPRHEKTGLEFAIGKQCEDLGLYKEAMQWFDRANETALQQSAFNREAYARSIQARVEIFGRSEDEQGLPDETPIFVVGMIRSGTTLVEQILSRHPLVTGAGEQKFWPSVEPTFLDLRNRRLNGHALRSAASTYARLLNRYRGSSERVVDKQPGNLLLAGALHRAFPNARIVYMHRDPLDNAISIWNTNVQTALPFMHDRGNLAFAIQRHEELMRHWQAVLPPERFIIFSYEALVDDQERCTRKLVEFCGLPWDDACLTPEKGTSKVTTPSLMQVRQPVYRSSVGRWKNYEPWLGAFDSLRHSKP